MLFSSLFPIINHAIEFMHSQRYFLFAWECYITLRISYIIHTLTASPKYWLIKSINANWFTGFDMSLLFCEVYQTFLICPFDSFLIPASGRFVNVKRIFSQIVIVFNRSIPKICRINYSVLTENRTMPDKATPLCFSNCPTLQKRLATKPPE